MTISTKIKPFIDPLHEGCKYLAYAQSKYMPRTLGIEAKDIQISITVRNGLLITTVQWPNPSNKDELLVQQEVESCTDLITEDF